MTEENKTEEKRPTAFLVKSMVRSKHTKGTRISNGAGTTKMKQFLDGQHRIVRGRPMTLSEAQFLKLLPQIKEKVRLGFLEVTSLDGRILDLETMTLGPAAGVPPTPAPRMDSIAKDVQNVGEKMVRFQGNDPFMANLDASKVPDLVKAAPVREAAPPPPPPPPAQPPMSDEDAELMAMLEAEARGDAPPVPPATLPERGSPENK